ncbi:MAG TPA: CpXC domain-containing protein [Anaerolineales bacterium]|nr:CpXC domain-containing protein [Anaerolineales bacterium]
MPRTRINCPNCRQPIMADVQQLFDVNKDGSAKANLLSGMVNFVQCPNCGYQGNLATPIVYHDPEKEMLLTFVPPELGLPHAEQERMLGAMINQVVNNLAPEQRKGYLLRPQAQLTMQGLVERILEADGITREMIQAQQQRLNLLQRLLTVKDGETRKEIIKQEEKLVDADLFSLLSRLHEAAAGSGDQPAAAQLEELQATLIETTDFGRQVKQQAEEVQAAVMSLQEAGRELTREKLLDIVVAAPSDLRLSALVSLARPGMDYPFFQLLSERIEKSSDPEKERLTKLRERLLELTRQVDAQLEARTSQAHEMLNQLMAAPDPAKATSDNLPQIDDFFVQVLNAELQAVRKTGDLEKIGKLQAIAAVLQQASAPPPEIALIEELLDAPDDQARRRLLEEKREQITPEFLQMLSGLVTQVMESNQEAEFIERFKAVNRLVLRFSMETNLRGG